MKDRRKLILFSMAAVLAVLVLAEGAARVLYSFYYRSPAALMYGFRYSNLGAIARGLSKKRAGEWKEKERERLESIGRQKGIGRINSYGFVGSEFSVRKPDGVFRIVAMGGSTTQGKLGGASAGLYPYTEFLQDIFEREGPRNSLMRKVEVINAGKAGMDLKGIYRRLREKVLRLDPDLIILSSGWNNIMSLTGLALQTEQRVAFSTMTRLSRYSLFVVGMRAIAGKVLYGDSSYYWVRIDRAKMARVIGNHPAFPEYRALLSKTIRLLREKAICVLLVRQPYKYPKFHFSPPNRLYYLYPIIRIHEILEAVSRELRVPVVDAEAYFNAFPEKETLFTDVMHMTPRGYEKLARVIYRSIIDYGLLEKRGCGRGSPDGRRGT